MKTIPLLLFSGIMVLLSWAHVQAQYVITQTEYSVPVSLGLIPDDMEFDQNNDEAMYILELPESRIREAAEEDGEPLTIENLTISMDGNKLAVDTRSEEGRTTVISDLTRKGFYLIAWPEKKVYEVSSADMKQMQQQAEAASQAMLSQLPPEQAEQVRAAMKAARNSSSAKITDTGEKMTKYGFDCEKYIIRREAEVTIVWAAEDSHGLSRKAKAVSGKLAEMLPSGENAGNDEWDLLPGKIPVEVRSYSTVSEPAELTVRCITQIDFVRPQAKAFAVPGTAQGFTKGSFMDMMQGMAE